MKHSMAVEKNGLVGNPSVVLQPRLHRRTDLASVSLPDLLSDPSVLGLLAALATLHICAPGPWHLLFLHLRLPLPLHGSVTHFCQFSAQKSSVQKALPDYSQNSSPCPFPSLDPALLFFIALIIWNKSTYLFVSMFITCFPWLERSLMLSWPPQRVEPCLAYSSSWTGLWLVRNE